MSDAQIDRERMTDQLERLLSANKELQDNMEVLQTELGRKQVEYDNLREERYDFFWIIIGFWEIAHLPLP